MGEQRLVMVLGTSPAVVTETLYELEAECRFKLGIRRIDLISTTTGRMKSEDDLRRELARFAQDYKTPTIETNWHLVESAAHEALDDIVTETDSEQAANLILCVVRECCAKLHNTIHASLAGGRKTMSYYMGLAMSLYARENDRLYHVLVPPELEDPRSGFFYPAPGVLSPITLQELPFPRLRGFLERQDRMLYEREQQFTEIVRAANAALDPALPNEFSLVFDVAQRTVWIKESAAKPLILEPNLISIFETVLVKLSNKPHTLEEITGVDPNSDPEVAMFGNRLSNLNRHLEKSFGFRARIIIQDRGSRSHPAKYRLPPGMSVEAAHAN